MSAAPLPAGESERLAALAALEILDTERTAEFDIFPALAQGLFATPIAAISLVDETRQWFKSSIGVESAEMPRELSFCAHAILDPDEVLCIPDASADPRFADNPLVLEGGLRFYAGMPIRGPEGHAVGALCVIDNKPRDIAPETLGQLKLLALGVSNALKLHASVQSLSKLTVTDPLTRTQNRAGFEFRLRAALARLDPTPPRVGLLFLDLDGFKAINDLFGHGGGDAALKEVALRLTSSVRSGDVVGRFGGDEFCILVEKLRDPADLHTLSMRIHAALAEPFQLEGQFVPLCTSIGMASCLAGELDAESLVRKADAALYEAKRAGPGSTRLADADADPGGDKALVGRNETEALLRRALFPPGHEPFTVALQPMFHGQSGSLLGFEALVRWSDADGVVRQPADFIPIAESTGMVVQIDRWMLDQACRLAGGWPEHLQISSNLSAANFLAGDLVADVQAMLDRYGLAPGRLKLEVTETVLLCDPARVRRTIAALRHLGVHVVLDDFGTGHASIARLREYAFDGLKIDRSFVSGLDTDPENRVFVRAIIQMARALGIEVTAEGVETDRQRRMLRRQRIGVLQGYLLGRPMTVADADGLIRQHAPDVAAVA